MAKLSNKAYECMLAAFQAGNSELEQALNTYYEADIDDELRYVTCRRMIQICDEILSAGNWHATPFLRRMIAPVDETRNTLQEALAEREEDDANVVDDQCADGMQEVFIALYQADGHNLAQWAVLIRSLPQFMLGRPSYDCQAHAESFLRAKSDRFSQAYARVFVAESAVLDDIAGARLDNMGQRLLSIAQGSLAVENIKSFHHMNKVYRFNGKDLIEIE